jgi:hypothetical protein
MPPEKTVLGFLGMTHLTNSRVSLFQRSGPPFPARFQRAFTAVSQTRTTTLRWRVMIMFVYN